MPSFKLFFSWHSRAPHKRNVCKLYYLYISLLATAIFLYILAIKNDTLKNVYVGFTPFRPSRSPQAEMWSLKSSPTPRFRENLVDGVKYVTAWPIEGFTNQYIAQVNLLYLAYLAGRVAILPSFVPTERHMGQNVLDPLPVSEIFDIPKLVGELRRPILEWKDIKNISSPEVEDIGCWSVFKTAFGRVEHFRSEQDLSLDVSFTQVPDSAKIKIDPVSIHTNIMSLASLGWSESHADALKIATTTPSPIHKHNLPPDETLLCFDNLYYVGAARDFEWERAWSPSWNLVGQYMTFTPHIEELTRALILRAFGMALTDPIPSYIGVHIRHTDFGSICNNKPWKNCFAPLSVFAARVAEIREILEIDHGIIVDKVLVTSDEKNQTWWDSVRELGWKSLEHNTTIEMYGTWQVYPIILDSSALSFAKGFVGTRGSTMSLLASKRVQLWANGPVRDVPIGPL
ncbi:hypothetical protein K439DRAFT_1403466 [Ramaria rubella]|nr:hypothetical protein K439DRAFT_1403466 [Ramaria rubella]